MTGRRAANQPRPSILDIPKKLKGQIRVLLLEVHDILHETFIFWAVYRDKSDNF